MAETLANLLDLTKEVWTQDRLERQFYNKNLWFDKVERTNKYSIGRQAQVPVETGLPGGATTHTAAGGSLNEADALHVDRADYVLAYQWQQVELQVGALAQAVGPGVHSTVDAADQTVASNIDAMRRELGRQSVSNQDALIAATTGSATSAEVELSTTGYGMNAIERGWLRPGLLVDIGTAGAETSAASDRTITAVEEVAASPSITVSGADVVLTANEFVSVANARSGATSKETNGLRQIVGSTTAIVGTINPATSSFWKPAHVDTTTTLASLELLLTMQRKVFQKTGQNPKFVATSPYQAASLYSQFQNQVRFDSDKVNIGDATFSWNGIAVTVDPDIPDRELYMLTLSDFFIVTGAGEFGKPAWMSDVTGSGGKFSHVQGTTRVNDAVVYPIQIAIKRRNSHASAIGLTA